MAATFDIDTFTIGDAEDFETVTGMTVQELYAEFEKAEAKNGDIELPFRIVVALIWLRDRRTNPELTVEEVRKYKLSDLTGTPEGPPTEGAESPTNGSVPSAPPSPGAPPPPSAHSLTQTS